MKPKTADKHLRLMRLVSETDRQIIRSMFDALAEQAFNAGQSGQYKDYDHYIQHKSKSQPEHDPT